MMQLSLNAALLIPLIIGGCGLVALLIGLRAIRQNPQLRNLTGAYSLGFVTLLIAGGYWLATAGSRLLPEPTIQHVLSAILLFCWGAVALGLGEYLLVQRWVRNSGISVPRLARDIVRALAFSIAVLITLQLVFNIAPSSIVISSTILSAVIGLALQDLLKNVIAGVALQLERPFEIGHWIQVGDAIGKVVEMSWRATRLITVDGNYLIHPNSDLAATRVINYTLPEPLQAMHTQIALSYVHPPNTIKQVLVEAMLASADVSPNPAPSVKVIAYGDYSITYDLKFWLFNYDGYPDKRDAVMTNAWYALQRAGVKLPLPVREVYHHEDGPQEQANRRREHLARIMTDLRTSAVLDGLSEPELTILSERVHARLYGAGDVLVRQGEPGEALFILRTGQVRVEVRGEQAPAVVVNQLGAGECFGEMALMTGEPRGATIVAERDTEVLVVMRNDIAPILHNNPALPERLGTILAQRREMNQAVLARQSTAHDMVEDPMPRPTLVARIRHFFGMTRDEE